METKKMPAKSKAQQRLFGAALNAKRGGKTFPLAQKLAGQMNTSQLQDFAANPVVPTKKGKKAKTYL
jgi:hypothetical protein